MITSINGLTWEPGSEFLEPNSINGKLIDKVKNVAKEDKEFLEL